jgi:mRNA interferase MazF
MTAYERGDVVLVPFPFSNQSAIKKRPAIIVSSNIYNNISPDIIIMAVSSRKEKPLGIGECLIKDWQDAGLLKPSAAKSAVSTIERNLVLKKLGKLSTTDLLSLENALKELFGL